MSIEKQIQEKIKELLTKINESIPTEWDELFVHLEISGTGGRVFFFFKAEDEDEYHYSCEIPEEFGVSERLHSNRETEQFYLGYDLRNMFVQNELDVWTNATIIVIDGKMNLTFDYTPWLVSDFGPTDRRCYFMYRYLGYSPSDEKERELFMKMEEYQNKFKA